MSGTIIGPRNLEFAPSPLDQMTKAANLKRLMSENALAPGQQQLQTEQIRGAQLSNQQGQMEIDSQKALQKAFLEGQGDQDKTTKLALQYGALPKDVISYQKMQTEQKMHALDVVEKQGNIAKVNADLMQGAHDVISSASPELKPQVYKQQLQGLQQRGVDVSQMPPEYPGDEAFKYIGVMVKSHAQQVEDALKASETSKNKSQGASADAEANLKNMEAQNGGSPAVAEGKYRTILMNQTMKQPVSPEDLAFKDAYEKQKTLVPTAKFQLGGDSRGQARSDKSYQYSNTVLDKVGQPIEAAVQRVGRLKDTLAQGSPQADALVAPELLSVMAGGAGSGLRMNEAEIARIVGGRSNWESLKASANKWSLDPSSANSITPAQRQQIRSLVNTVNEKLLGKQQIMDQARQDLINADDPREHRRIVADARNKLTKIDIGSGSPTQGGQVIYARDPQGTLHTAPAGTQLPQGWKLEQK